MCEAKDCLGCAQGARARDGRPREGVMGKSAREAMAASGRLQSFIGMLNEEAKAVGLDDDEYVDLFKPDARHFVREMVLNASNRNFVFVPDNSSNGTLATTKSRLMMYGDQIDDRFLGWDFMHDSGGEFYEVTRFSSRNIGTDSNDVRAYFQEKGFEGNVAAFLVWIEKERPNNAAYGTIPPDDKLRKDSRSDQLLVPFLCKRLGKPVLDFQSVNSTWFSNHVFVGFKKIMPALRQR